MRTSEAAALEVFWDRCEGPIVFGVNDCCMTLADTIRAAGGPDLLAAYRGRYTTPLGYVRVFRRAGHRSLFAACDAAMAEMGKPVERPEDFDVAVVGHPGRGGEMRESPAFFHGGFWHLRSDAGGFVVAHDAFQGQAKIYRVL